MSRIGVHGGCFHLDDALACAIMKRYFARWGETPEIIRTRDPKTLSQCDYRIDVGGKFSPETCDFDHHQREFAETRPNGIKFAAAGLCWREFAPTLDLSPEVIARVDESLIAPSDASDNGQKLFESTLGGCSPYSLSAAISALNPTWEEQNNTAAFDAAFAQAVEIAGVFLDREIASAKACFAAAPFVKAAIDNAADPRVIVLEKCAPWLETVLECAPSALFVVYPTIEGEYMVQAIPPKLGSFEQRKPLPSAWAGLRGEAFASLSGVADGIFCHPARFICGARSLEGALALAKLAVA